MPRSMNELQGLHDKLDLADAAAAEFHVAMQVLRANNIALNALLDVRDLPEQDRESGSSGK